MFRYAARRLLCAALTSSAPSTSLITPVQVSPATFDEEVLGSELAIVLMYHTDTQACFNVLDHAKKVVTKQNGTMRSRWLKLCCVDADMYPSLAGAFSIQRNRLPVSFFIFQGTIVDRVTGEVSEEKLNDMCGKFRTHFCNIRGIDLTHGATEEAGALRVAPRSSLTGDESLSVLLNSLYETPMKDVAAWEKAWETAAKKARAEETALRQTLRLDQRSIPYEELRVEYYDKECIVSGAVLHCLRILHDVIVHRDTVRAHKHIEEFAESNVHGAVNTSKEVRERFAKAELEYYALRIETEPSLAGDILSAARDKIRSDFLAKREYDAAVRSLVECLRPAARKSLNKESRDVLVSVVRAMMAFLGTEHATTVHARQKLHQYLY